MDVAAAHRAGLPCRGRPRLGRRNPSPVWRNGCSSLPRSLHFPSPRSGRLTPVCPVFNVTVNRTSPAVGAVGNRTRLIPTLQKCVWPSAFIASRCGSAGVSGGHVLSRGDGLYFASGNTTPENRLLRTGQCHLFPKASGTPERRKSDNKSQVFPSKMGRAGGRAGLGLRVISGQTPQPPAPPARILGVNGNRVRGRQEAPPVGSPSTVALLFENAARGVLAGGCVARRLSGRRWSGGSGFVYLSGSSPKRF